jgi:hypothetical protein
MKRKFILVWAIVSLVVGVGWQATASAAPPYGPNGAQIATSSSAVFPGGSVRVSGVNFKPRESVTLTLHSPPVVLGTTSTGRFGSFSTQVTIPAGTQPGAHTIVATGAQGDSASTGIVVRQRPSPPVITSGPSATATVGQFFSFQVTATGFPAPSFSEAGGLPAGVHFSFAGVLSGTPRTRSAGTYRFTIIAGNAAGSARQRFTLTVVQPLRPPSIISGPTATAAVGRFFAFSVTATGFPAPRFSEVGGLPAGVSFSSSGILSGTPRTGSAGTYPFTITATNSAGSASQAFTLTVVRADPPPHH